MHRRDVDEICPVEDQLIDEEEAHESANVKPLKSPAAPSRQEVLEHDITHYPFRSWCSHCVRWKCKSSKHSATGRGEESEVQIVGFDYAFLCESNRKHEDGDDEAEELESAMLKVLVGHDSKAMYGVHSNPSASERHRC